MTPDRVEAMLEQITKANNQVLTWLAIGFISGFCIGTVAAWLMFSIAK